MELLSSSPDETEAIAGRLARLLAPGDVITVAGELGVTQPVTSPTFTIGHRYRGRIDVSHLDLYRFAGVSSAEWGDLEPYFDDAVVFVEWPEAGAGVLPAPRIEVRLEHGGEEGQRLVTIQGDADPGLRHGD